MSCDCEILALSSEMEDRLTQVLGEVCCVYYPHAELVVIESNLSGDHKIEDISSRHDAYLAVGRFLVEHQLEFED